MSIIKKDIKIQIGNTPQQIAYTPTVFSSSTPYLVWELPDDVEQKRYNIRFKSYETNAEYTTGEIVSNRQYFQWPFGMPMSDLWLGLLHIEIVISSNPTVGADFEFTSGDNDNWAVYDKIAEDILNTHEVIYRWRNVFDVDNQSLQYQIQVATHPLFKLSDIIMDKFVNDSGGIWTDITGQVDFNRVYFWRVRAYDGLDYGRWSVVNGFRTVENIPPIIRILNIFVLDNDFGDVLIEFEVEDRDDEYINVICTYTGGNQGLEKKNCSLINSLNYLPNGKHSVIWRSSRDEQKIKADDYQIQMIGWDGKTFGEEVKSDVFSLDNRRFGYEPGGFGSVDIEFPLSAYFVKRIENLFNSGHLNPYIGYINCDKLDILELIAVITPFLKNYVIFSVGRNILPLEDFGISDRLEWPSDFTNKRRQADIHGKPPFDRLEDNGNACVYTLDNTKLGNDGYPISFDFRRWTIYNYRKGFIKIYRLEYGYEQAHPIYGWKNWEVVYENGIYKRKEVNNGLRGQYQYGGKLIKIGVPYWIPIEEILTPVDWNAYAIAKIVSRIYNGKWQHIVGLHDERVWPTTGFSYDIVGTTRQLDCLRPIADFVKKNYANYQDNDNYIIAGFIKLFSTFLPKLNLKILSEIGQHFLEYFSGYSPTENPGFVTRPEPPYFYDKGIKIIGEITKSETIEPLKIIYLQTLWDAYNTIHWQATLGYTTKVHLQYTKYYTNDTHGPWIDALTKDVEYDADLLMYLIQPLRWYAYLETLNPNMFENNKEYRFRIRLVDSVSHTFSPFVYSNKFKIEHHAINPANILNTYYEKWNKEIHIEFRLDDTQGDLYDIIGMDYSLDGQTWLPVELRDIRGRKSLLESNKYGDSGNIITHKIIWRAYSYGLEVNDNYRVRLHVTYSDITEGVTKPIFSWWIYNNPILRNIENQIAELQGKTQSYVWDAEASDWVLMSEPKQIPGLLQFNNDRILDIKSNPPPSGMYIYFEDGDEYKQLIDPSGYQNWLNTDIGGATRGEIIRQYEERNKHIIDELIPDLYNKRNMAEMETRKDLIKQGFYCNGYINNDMNKEVFRYRVESKPYDDSAANNVFYNTRWEVYYRIQIDFFETFDSQEGKKPLRDIRFHEDGTLIQAGPYRSETLVNSQGDVWKNKTEYDSIGLQIADKNQDNQVWSGEQEVDLGQPGNSSIEGGIYTETPETFDTRGFGTYRLPKSLLPGERNNFYLNASYPSMTDTLPQGIESFNYDYYWRICAYNIITAQIYEQPRILITNLEVHNELDYLEITFKTKAVEEMISISHLAKYNYYNHQWVELPEKFYFSIQTKIPEWIDKKDIQFITDRPTDVNGNIIQDDRILTSLVPEGIERIRPIVVIDDMRHYYNLWYSKKNIYNQYTIVQAMGRTSFQFAEYAQCFPYNITDRIENVINSATAFYAPYILKKDDIYKMWMTVMIGGKNYIYYTETDYNFYQWDKVELVTGIDNAYYPSVLYLNDIYYMWIGKHLTKSEIYLYKSQDGINWQIDNNGNPIFSMTQDITSPYVIWNNGYFIMYFTEYYNGSNTRISSVISQDGISWTDYQIEIDDNYVSNPCVVVDRYMGNNVFRIYYNQIVNGKQIIKTSFLEDRIWQEGAWGSLKGDWKNLTTSINGEIYKLKLNLSSNNITSTDDIKVRLNFYNDVTEREFYVHSTWVSEKNINDTQSKIFPEGKFKYHEILKALNY